MLVLLLVPFFSFCACWFRLQFLCCLVPFVCARVLASPGFVVLVPSVGFLYVCALFVCFLVLVPFFFFGLLVPFLISYSD